MISIVIPAYNEEDRIALCLGAFENQDTAESFEVIMVNNASADRTVEIAKKCASKINLKIITEPKKGRGSARRRGFLEARGEIILSTDADCHVPNDWISRMASALRNSDAVAISGSFQVEGLSPVKAFIFRVVQSCAARMYRIYFRHWWLNGFNFGIYKKVYDEAGGFNPNLNAQEDIDLSMKVSKLGRIQYLPEIKIFFSGRRFDAGVFRGLTPYLTSFLGFYWKKNMDVHLDDPR